MIYITCSVCERTWEDSELPEGWELVNGKPVCPSCLNTHEIQLELF
jgi:hypothetical protein